MTSGLNLTSWTGREGRILVPGLGAVLGTFASWTLTRPQGAASDARWALAGVLSYVNETLVRQEGLPLRIQIRLDQDEWRDLDFERADLVIEGSSIRCSGVTIHADS